MSERLLDVENEAMLKIVELEKQLMQTNKELDQLRVSTVSLETASHCHHGDRSDAYEGIKVRQMMMKRHLQREMWSLLNTSLI